MTLLPSPDTKHAIAIYKLGLSLLGVWPLSDKGILRTIHSVLMIFALVIISIPECIYLYFNRRNSDNIIDNLTTNVSINMVIIKLITLHFYRDNMATCLNSVIDDWERTQDIEYRKIMKRHSTFARRVCISIYTVSYFTSIMFVILSGVITALTDCSVRNSTGPCKLLPLPASYIIDTDISPIYEFLFLLQSFEIWISSTGNCAIDCFIFFLTMHICGQLELLKIDFRRTAQATVSLQSNTAKVKMYRNRIICLTKRHYELIRFSETLQDSINMMIFLQLFVSSMLICVVGFQFISLLETDDIPSAGKYMFYTIWLMMEIFLFCYAGDHLQTQSTDLVYAAYESPWYDMPSKVARDLLFVMIRAAYPFHISAGKFFVMTLENFTVIVKTSVSYLSVLRVMVN